MKCQSRVAPTLRSFDRRVPRRTTPFRATQNIDTPCLRQSHVAHRSHIDTWTPLCIYITMARALDLPSGSLSYRGKPLLYTLTPVVASLSDVAYWFAPLLVHALQSTTAALEPMVF